MIFDKILKTVLKFKLKEEAIMSKAKQNQKLIAMVSIFLFSFLFLLTEVPLYISWQGRIHDSDEVPLNDDVSIDFAIYADSTGGTALWTETQDPVSVIDGLFQVKLGSVNPLPEEIFDESERWISLNIEGDGEMTPRTEIVSVAYAMQAGSSEPDNDWTITDDDMYSALSGNVGIGSYSPEAKLEIESGSFSDPVSLTPTLALNTTDGENVHGLQTRVTEIADGTSLIMQTGTGGSIAYTPDGGSSYPFIVNNDGETSISGNVGIGLNEPEAKLHVSGGKIYISDAGDSTGIKIAESWLGDHYDGILHIQSSGGVVAFDGDDNVGIGIESPEEKLDVGGNIHSSGSIKSGNSLTLDGVNERLLTTSGEMYFGRDQSTGDFENVKVGIGTQIPLEKLDVTGTVKMTGFKMPTGASNGYVLTADSSGIGNWQAGAGGGIDGSGTANYIPKFTAPTTLDNSGIYETGNNIGIGTTSPEVILDISGSPATGKGQLRISDSSGDDPFISFYGNSIYKSFIGYSNGVAQWGSADGSDLVISGGKVGIGTTSPAEMLHINKPSGSLGIRITSDSTSYQYLNFGATNGYSIGRTNNDKFFINRDEPLGTGASNLLTIKSNCDIFGTRNSVGIGTSSPDQSSKLHVESNSDAQNLGIYSKCAPTDGIGIGGSFEGGYTGLKGSVNPPGTNVTNYYGVSGVVSGGAGNNFGVMGEAYGSGQNYGVRGTASGSGSNYGIYGYADGSEDSWAGYFNGNVHITGTLSKGSGSFRIDHPLDPENKFLYHSFVESPDMMNVYNGNAILNEKGEAIVNLPDYFNAVNKDFRYQLTCIGGFAPVYIAEKIDNNQFKIAGGKENLEVSWQITGIRKDPYAEKNRIQVEVDKEKQEKGKYLHPEVYGLEQKYGMNYEKYEKLINE